MFCYNAAFVLHLYYDVVIVGMALNNEEKEDARSLHKTLQVTNYFFHFFYLIVIFEPNRRSKVCCDANVITIKSKSHNVDVIM